MSRRRRRGRNARRMSLGAATLVAVAVAVVLVLVIGSLAEVHNQSAPYRRATTRGYVALVAPVVDASNQTGSHLASLLDRAPSLPVGGYPQTGRAILQQGLDQAVAEAQGAASRARQLVPPSPSGGLGAGIDDVLDARAAALAELRTAIDGLLELAPLPVAGAPAATDSPVVPHVSLDDATRVLGAQGAALEAADRRYASLASQLRRGKGPDGVRAHLPASVWVPAKRPVLGSSQLAALAAALDGNQGLRPIRLVRVLAVGVTPAAVPVASGGTGVIGVTCDRPFPPPPGGSGSPTAGPAMLPPTSTVTAHVTVTNCGTTDESGASVTVALALADPAGQPAPGPAARGSAATLRIASIRAGASAALDFPPLRVASGHSYRLTITAKVPEGQDDPTGTVQSLSIHVAP